MSTHTRDKTDRTKHQSSTQNSDKNSGDPDVSKQDKAKYTATKGEYREKVNKLIGRVSKYISAWTSVSEKLKTNKDLPKSGVDDVVESVGKQEKGWESLKNALQRIKDVITNTSEYDYFDNSGYRDEFDKACKALDSLAPDIDQRRELPERDRYYHWQL